MVLPLGHDVAHPDSDFIIELKLQFTSVGLLDFAPKILNFMTHLTLPNKIYNVMKKMAIHLPLADMLAVVTDRGEVGVSKG